MIKKVVFFNLFHNGDIHLSRGFVRKMVEKFPHIEFEYCHQNNMDILSDIHNLSSKPFYGNIKNKNDMVSHLDGEILYLNTWYGAGRNKYLNTYGITFDTLYYLFNDHMSHFGMSIQDLASDPKDLFPTIDFNKFNLIETDKYLENSSFNKRVFISNGETLSGQAHNFDFSPIINTIASNYSNILFIVSNKSKSLNLTSNVALSENIIKKNGFDLNENAYLTTKCDLIIGRSSGVFSFAMIKDNLFNKDKKMLSFSTIGSDDGKYWLGNNMDQKITYDAEILNYYYNNTDAMKKMEEKIRELWESNA